MKFSFLTISLLAALLAPQGFAQTKTTRTTTATRGAARTESKAEARSKASGAADEDSAVERRADAARDVVVSLCLASGDVVVRGSDRAEVRARLEEEGGLRLDTGGGQPARRVEVIVAPNERAEAFAGGCGSASNLELTVPRGASVNVESRSGNVQIADVADVHVQATSGDVDVRRASKSVEVSALSGDISLADSTGPARLTAVSGSVEARNARALAPGDTFEAKSTSGDISLEGVAHSQVSGATVSGGVIYTGALARGGVYDFLTISGDVTLELPADSSFTLHAKVMASGDIVTDFPVKTFGGASATPPSTPAPPPGPHGPGRTRPPNAIPPYGPVGTHLDGTVGTGDAVVNLSSFSGSVRLRRR
jgi:hypothetical protein